MTTMRIERKFTQAGSSPYAAIAFRKVEVEICHADPKQRVCIADFEVPANWSYAASEFLVRHYVCKHEVASRLKPVNEKGVPSWLRRMEIDKDALLKLPREEHFGSEVSAKQIFHRLVGAWTYWGWNLGYFDSEEDAKAFYDESCYMLAAQLAAPASPQWMNTGLHWAYGMSGDAHGHYYVDAATGKIIKSDSAYARPQHHHCFIQGVKDELVSDGGIMDLWEREARAFKYGSGAGSNMSCIRSSRETMATGEHSVGLMRFLSIGDKAAAAVKSGGRGLQIEKLALVDIDHPDIQHFIRWKVEEEHKAASLITGARMMRKHLGRIMDAVAAEEGTGAHLPQQNSKLKHAIKQAKRAMIPESYIARVLDYAKQGITEITIPIYGAEEQSDVFLTVGAHQAHLAVRVSDKFLMMAEAGGQWPLTSRSTKQIIESLDASELFDHLAQAGWATGDPTIQFDDNIQAWHGCSADGPIAASSPHGEFLFLNDSACDVATLNVMGFLGEDGQFAIERFEHASRLLMIMLDISISMAQFPSREIARNTYRYRPTGLSLCNMATLLMSMGYAYDSNEGRATAAAIAAIMTGTGYVASAEMAKELGAFEAYAANRDSMLKLMHRHHEAVHGRTQFLGSLEVVPQVLDYAMLPDTRLADAAQRIWDKAVVMGDEHGFSNAQVSVVAISPNVTRLMDADSQSVMPDRGVVKYALQSQGKYRKYVPKHVLLGLAALGYTASQINDIVRYVRGCGSLKQAPAIHHQALMEKGFTDEEIGRIEEALGNAVSIQAAFDPFVIGESFCRNTLKISDAQIYDANFDVLQHIGFSVEEIETANHYACGYMSMSGAPHLNPEDLPVFDSTIDALYAQRYVSIESQIRMIAAVQPFISGGIAHRITTPNDASIQQCRHWMMLAWRAGLKTLTLYRLGCGLHDRMELLSSDLAEELTDELSFNAPKFVAFKLAEVMTAHKGRRELPLRRGGYTQKAAIGGQTVYLRTGEYPEGSLGEIFIDTPKQPAPFRHLVNQFAVAISIALQYGVPLEAFVDAYRACQFEPCGRVEGNASIDTATSILDYIFRELSLTYLQTDVHEAPADDDVAAQVLAWRKRVQSETEDSLL